MLTEIANLFNNLDDLNVTHYSEPCSVWVVDDFLPTNIFETCLQEINTRTIWEDVDVKTPLPYVTRYEYRKLDKTPYTESIINYLNAGKFLTWIESKSKYSGLLPDPYLHGGGVCRIPAGKTLTVHKDFNWNDKIKCSHVINACLYMDTGGDLQFWDGDECIFTVDVKPNRLIFWEDPHLYKHGFSEMLETDRTNLVLFYYESDCTPPENVNKSYEA